MHSVVKTAGCEAQDRVLCVSYILIEGYNSGDKFFHPLREKVYLPPSPESSGKPHKGIFNWIKEK
jgi:hypothetical protein